MSQALACCHRDDGTDAAGYTVVRGTPENCGRSSWHEVAGQSETASAEQRLNADLTPVVKPHWLLNFAVLSDMKLIISSDRTETQFYYQF